MITAKCPKCESEVVTFCYDYNEYQCINCGTIFKIKEMNKNENIPNANK